MLGLVCVVLPQRAGSQEALKVSDSVPQARAASLADPAAWAATDGAAELSAPAQPPTFTEMSFGAGQPSLPAMDSAAGSGGGQVKDGKPRVEQELIVEGLVSYGNYKIFASGEDEKLFTWGVEYDRHSWGRFLGAQMDYVAEFLPFVLLDKPLSTDIWGSPSYPVNQSKAVREYVPGIGFSPIGFRMQWRSAKRIRPYLEAKGGVLVFTKKVPSSEATYENFSLQSAGGVQVMMNKRWGLRLGLFSDFHFSDDFIVPVNPGLDVMNANLGLSYHF